MRAATFLGFVGLVVVAFTVGGCESRARGRVALATGPQESSAPAEGLPGGMPGGPGMPGGSGPPAFAGPGGAAAARRASGTRPDSALSFTALSESRTDRYLIKNAELTIEVRDVRQAAAGLVTAAQAAGGYVSGSREMVDGLGSRSSTVEARVPHQRFEAFLRQLAGMGKVLVRVIAAEDVTEEFVDSEARLRNLKRTELRLLEHLNRTARLADVLLVEKELGRVRGEIDRLEGRLRFLGHRVTFSSVTVTFQETPRSQALAPPEGYSIGKEASAAVRALVAFGRVLWTGAIWAGIWAAVWGPLAVAGWLAHRRRRAAVAAG